MQIGARSAEWWDGWARLDQAWRTVGGAPLSPFWSEWVRSWGQRRREVVRVGRRGGKSTMICRLATTEALWSPAVVPAGDVGVVAIVSVDRREAGERIATIGKMLDALGIHDERKRVGDSPIKRKSYADSIELDLGERGERAIRVYTATVAGVSGFTSIAAFCDEVAKWRDRETQANPAREVLASLRPTLATQREAVIMMSSSPWAEDDAHAEAFARGDGPGQRVSYAPTWIANPTVSEEQTHEDEPDEMEWSREYLAVPMRNVASAWFDPDAIRAACGEVVPCP